MQKLTLGALTLLASAGMTVGATNIVHATTIDATGATFQFGVDGQTVTGVGYLGGSVSEGTSIRYSNVATIDGTVIDAVVTFVAGTNMNYDELTQLDAEFPEDEGDPFIESVLEADSNDSEATAEIRVDFFMDGTEDPITISNLSINIYDIDSLQWVEVVGAAGYSLATSTHLAVTSPTSGTYRFTSPDASTDSEDGTSYTVGRAKIVLSPSSSVTYRLGVPDDGSFDVDFSPGLPWQDDFGGSEDTSTLPSTGFAMWSIFALAVVAIAGGAAIEMKRRTSN